jgi:hypothetical protein
LTANGSSVPSSSAVHDESVLLALFEIKLCRFARTSDIQQDDLCRCDNQGVMPPSSSLELSESRGL